jgi:SAM-dependent methyltransferase
MPEPSSNEALREEFNRWAEAGRGEGMEEDHLPIVLPVLDQMKLARDENVLDMGCGAGWLVRLLAERVPEGRVIGMDISDEMVRRARRNYVAAGKRHVRGWRRPTKFPGTPISLRTRFRLSRPIIGRTRPVACEKSTAFCAKAVRLGS